MQPQHRGSANAWTAEPAGEHVGVRGSRRASATASSVAHDEALRRSRTGGVVTTFDAMYSPGGRPSIPPERLLKASLLISLYSVRSERFLRATGLRPAVALVAGHEPDGAQLGPVHLQQESWPVVAARGRSAVLRRGGPPGGCAGIAVGRKVYDARACVATMREYGVTPHVAQNTSGRRSTIDRRTTRHRGYATSQRIRKRVEEVCGWIKAVGGFRRTRYRGLARTQLAGYLVATAYNLVRMARLAMAQAAAV